jgi:hypothetical protein
MTQEENRAVDAIWKTDMEHANEKLVLYHLATKHELGDRYSSAWKNLDRFLDEFQPRWSHVKDIRGATQLSEVKLQRTIEALQKKGYIESQPNSELRHHGGIDAFVYGITPKIFDDYRRGQIKGRKQA